MGWINLGDAAPPGFFTLRDDDPYYISPEEEAAMERDRECQHCDGFGRVEVFTCEGVCECGMCPELGECPECLGHNPNDECDHAWQEHDVYGENCSKCGQHRVVETPAS